MSLELGTEPFPSQNLSTRGSAIVPSPTRQSPSRPTLHVVEGGLGKDQISRKRSGPVVPYVEMAIQLDFQHQMLQWFQEAMAKSSSRGWSVLFIKHAAGGIPFSQKSCGKTSSWMLRPFAQHSMRKVHYFATILAWWSGKQGLYVVKPCGIFLQRCKQHCICDAGPSCISRQPSGAAMKSRPTHASRPILIHSMDRPKQHFN